MRLGLESKRKSKKEKKEEDSMQEAREAKKELHKPDIALERRLRRVPQEV